jgi:hypothetical protein
MTNPTHAAGTDLSKPDETTPEERAVLSAHFARRKQKRPSPRVKFIEKSGFIEITPDHPLPPLGNALIINTLESMSRRNVPQVLNYGIAGGPAPPT